MYDEKSSDHDMEISEEDDKPKYGYDDVGVYDKVEYKKS